ncbi:flagellar hook-basal body complex protein FliE [Hathewaya massiliensis]|uniref:flagellar hook-basal body complex protein FliE n=1 Tax=Hathewaya massiliensis TaxID=1964382 RepID=UPI0011586AD6|nr:flagellar hook-basal body complex protein FliE [Hathewaya massiliensis]
MKINEFIPVNTIKALNFEQSNKTINEDQGFSNVLKEKLDEVNNFQVQNEINNKKFIDGEDISIHQVMIGASEAKISLQYAIEIRNKLVDAYTELNRMQL